MKKKRKKNKKKVVKVFNVFCEKLLQKVDGPTMITDKKGDIFFANDEYLYFFCFSRKDVHGKDWIKKIIPPHFSGEVSSVFKAIKKRETVSRFDSPILVVGDPENRMRWTVLPLDDMDKYLFIGRAIYSNKNTSVKLHSDSRRSLNQYYQDVIEILFAAHNACEPGTAEHAYRVRSFSIALGRKLGLNKKQIDNLKVASMLHDIGKLAVDNGILYKQGKLSKEEFREIKKHPLCGSDMMKLIYFLEEIVPIIENHHENFDGSGYPKGIEGEDIPLESRVLAVADIYEALTADRPYRKGFSRARAVEIMKKEKWIKLDPYITDVFIRMIDNGEIPEERI